jgi:hypothetical protein
MAAASPPILLTIRTEAAETGNVSTFWIALFGVLTFLSFFVSLFAVDRPEGWTSIGFTGVMMAYWAVNLMMYFSWSEKLYVVTDTMFAVAALILFVRLRYPWVGALMILYCITVGLDVFLIVALGSDAPSKHVTAFRWYANLSNGIFVMQLIAASCPGWWTLLARARTILPADGASAPPKEA